MCRVGTKGEHHAQTVTSIKRSSPPLVVALNLYAIFFSLPQLSDVEKGGSTIFPRAGISVAPIKVRLGTEINCPCLLILLKRFRPHDFVGCGDVVGLNILSFLFCLLFCVAFPPFFSLFAGHGTVLV